MFTKKRLIWLGVVLALGLGGWAFLYTLRLWFTESLYSERGSYAFFVTITKPVIRSFPVREPEGEVEYHSGCGDGPKPPEQGVVYRSRLPVAELTAVAERHIRAHGYAPMHQRGSTGLAFTNGDERVYLAVTPEGDGTAKVDVTLLFD